MRIVCPSCSATFEVPKTRLAPGQIVRCARCGTDWTPLAEPVAEPALVEAAAIVAEPPPPAPDPTPGSLFNPELPVQPLSRPTWLASVLDRVDFAAAGGPALIAGWAVSIMVLAGLVWAAVSWRSNIMQAWPPSERLYMALGLPAEH